MKMLPLLEGWEDTLMSWSGTITKETKRVIERKARYGWIQEVLAISDDLYASFNIEYNRINSGFITPYDSKLYGYDNYFPVPGYCLRQYLATGPGTYGLFVIDINWWTYPFKGHTSLDVLLGDLSDYSSATLAISLAFFEITDMDVFKESLKKLYKELGLSREER